MHEVDSISIYKEVNSSYSIIVPMHIKRLTTAEEFERIVVNEFLEKPGNAICFDKNDMNFFCSQRGVFDALRVESSQATFDDDLKNGIKRLVAVHNGQRIQRVILQVTSRNGLSLEMENSLSKTFCIFKDHHVKFALGGFFSNPYMKVECCMYIIANFA